MDMKGRRANLLSPFLICLLLFVYIPSRCDSKPVIFNFGDSNSDTGTFVIMHGMLSQLAQFVTDALGIREQGRMCDGRVVLDFLCESLNARYLSPFTESVGPNFTNGVNFAMSGASILPRHGLFSLHGQVKQFARFKLLSLDHITKGIQDLLGNEDFNNALYVIDIGQNDLDVAFSLHSLAQVVERIPSFLAEIEYVMNFLYQLGARKFWVHNTGPLGCLPKILTRNSNYSASDFDQYGCARAVNDGARAFNDELRRLCDKFGREMTDATVVYVDVFAIKHDLVANSSLYGFDENKRACCGYGGGQYNYNSTIQCGVPGFEICEKRSKYVNWDGNHYTEAANEFIATKILSTGYSTPRVTPAHLFLPAIAPASTPIKLQLYSNVTSIP